MLLNYNRYRSANNSLNKVLWYVFDARNIKYSELGYVWIPKFNKNVLLKTCQHFIYQKYFNLQSSSMSDVFIWATPSCCKNLSSVWRPQVRISSLKFPSTCSKKDIVRQKKNCEYIEVSLAHQNVKWIIILCCNLVITLLYITSHA